MKMLKMKKKYTSWLFLSCCMVVGAQIKALSQVDPHFSQYYISPMTLNPALTGIMEGDYRVSSVFRSEYNNTLQVKGFSGDITTNKNCNIGVDILNESSNDRSYSYTTGHVSLSYTGVRLGPNADHCISMAVQWGFINRAFNVAKLQFGDQWASGVGYQPGTVSNEALNKPSVSAFDAGVGIAYYDAVPNKKVSFFGGIGAFHLTQPDNPFLSGSVDKLPIRYSIHAGVRIIGSDLFSIVPSAIFMKEGNAEEKMIGSYVQLYVDGTTDFMFGANWRINDAVSPFVGIYYNGLTIGVSYDVNATTLAGASSRPGSLELSISYTGKNKKIMKTKPFSCPRF
jgi:type IX secretion system PorP/SprF family membrane protein